MAVADVLAKLKKEKDRTKPAPVVTPVVTPVVNTDHEQEREDSH